MACFHPLKRFVIGVDDEGKDVAKIVSASVDHIEISSSSIICSPYHERGLYAERVIRDFQFINCGQCIGCRLDYSREWANRCMLELHDHESAHFITLTYNDKHLPRSSYVDPDTGELFTSYTLRKRDAQLFMKRLRKKFGAGVRFFLCGEYGEKSYRPHYHLIAFGLKLTDLQVYKRSPLGYTYYTSEALSRVWSIRGKRGVYDPIGYAVVGDVTWEACAYTARYIMKKMKGAAAEFYPLHGLEPEFTLMSRKPGIGRLYYDTHPDIYKYDYITLATEKKGLKFKPPKYYDRLFDLDHPDEMEEIKANRRRIAEDASKIKMEKCSLSYLDMLAVEENNLKSKAKKLIRSLEDV